MEGIQGEAVAAGQTQNSDGVDLAGEAVGTLLALGGEVALGQVVTAEALVTANVRGVEDRKRETRRSAHVYFVGDEAGKSVDGVVVGCLNMHQERIPVLLLLVAAHGQHQGHGVVDTLYAVVGAGVVRVGREGCTTCRVV